MSDMAADTTGNKSLDNIRTNQLCYEVIDFATKILKLNGTLISNYLWEMILYRLKTLQNQNLKKFNFLNQNQVETNHEKLIYIARH